MPFPVDTSDMEKAKLIGRYLGVDYDGLMREKDEMVRELQEHASKTEQDRERPNG